VSEQPIELDADTESLELMAGNDVIDGLPVQAHPQAVSKPVKRSFFGSLFKRNKPVEVKIDQGMVPASREDKSVLQLKKGYNEIVDTMSAMRTHMEQQSDRADRMLEIMEQLPKVLESIPETTTAQTHVLQAIHQNIQTQNETQVQLSAALTNLASATQQQEDAVKGIRNELSHQRGEQAEIINSLSGTLGQVTAASVANTDAMRAVAKKAEETDRNTAELFEKSRRNFVGVTVISWSTAALILVVSMFMFLELRKDRGAATVLPAQTPAVPVSSDSSASDPVVATDAAVVETVDETATPGASEGGGEAPSGVNAQAGIGALLDGLLESSQTPDSTIDEPAAVDAPVDPVDTPADSESSVDSDPAAVDASEVIETEAALDDAAPAEAIDEAEGAEDSSPSAAESQETADVAETSAETAEADTEQDAEPLSAEEAVAETGESTDS